MHQEVTLPDGSTILVRPYEMADVEPLYEAVRESIADISPWLTWCHADYSLEESQAWVEGNLEREQQETGYPMAVVDANSGMLLGGCGLNDIHPHHRKANLGYWVRSSRTGRGIAAAAARAVAQFGIRQLGLHRIEIVVAPGNSASLRVAEKMGATREGVLRSRIVVRDQIYDGVMHSLTAADLA